MWKKSEKKFGKFKGSWYVPDKVSYCSGQEKSTYKTVTVGQTAIVVGGTEGDTNHQGNNKVEKRSGNKWIELDDYPFVRSFIKYYAFANVENQLYLTGKI